MLLKPVAIALLVLLALPAAASEPEFPAGSRIGAVVPEGMEPSKRFAGFEDPSRAAALTFVEMPKEAFAEMAKAVTAESLASQGFKVTKREETNVGGRNAVVFEGDQEAAGIAFRKWLMLVEDESLTAFVVAQVRRDDPDYSAETIRSALVSLAIRAPLSPDEQMAALSFRVGDFAGFRVVKASGATSLLLTDGAKDAASEFDQPVALIVQVAAPVPPGGQRDALARQVFAAQNNLKEIAFERSEGFRQRGAEWHEIVARATDAGSGRPLVVTQTLRFVPGGFIRMVGIVRAEAREPVLPRFRRLFDSIEPK